MSTLIAETDEYYIYQADFGEPMVKSEGGWYTDDGKFAIPKKKGKINDT